MTFVRTAFVTALAMLLLAIPATASAMFARTTASAALSLSTGTLAAPRNVTVPATSTGTVAVSWTAPSNAPSSTSYYVTRKIGSTTSAACGTSSTHTVSALSCTDSPPASGSYTYTVTAVFYLWTATSSASGTVVFTLYVGQLDFTQNPQSTKSDQSLGTVIVQLRDNAGVAVNTSGVTVTLALGSNSTGGTLAGTLTATTDSNGTATFTGLSIDKVGTYTLSASATGYTSDSSASFTISVGPASQVFIVSGSGQTANRNTTFAAPLVVLVTDAEGNPVSGTTVEFTTPAKSDGTFSNGKSDAFTTSDASGQASEAITAGSATGTYHVTATLPSGASVSFTLTNR